MISWRLPLGLHLSAFSWLIRYTYQIFTQICNPLIHQAIGSSRVSCQAKCCTTKMAHACNSTHRTSYITCAADQIYTPIHGCLARLYGLGCAQAHAVGGEHVFRAMPRINPSIAEKSPRFCRVVDLVSQLCRAGPDDGQDSAQRNALTACKPLTRRSSCRAALLDTVFRGSFRRSHASPAVQLPCGLSQAAHSGQDHAPAQHCMYQLHASTACLQPVKTASLHCTGWQPVKQPVCQPGAMSGCSVVMVADDLPQLHEGRAALRCDSHVKKQPRPLLPSSVTLFYSIQDGTRERLQQPAAVPSRTGAPAMAQQGMRRWQGEA